MCMIIEWDLIYISWFMKKAEGKVTIFYPSPTFGRVQCSCDTLIWVSSLSNQSHWGSKWPPEASFRFIRICVHRPLFEYCHYSPESCSVLYLQKEIFRGEATRGLLSPISPNIHESRAFAWRDLTWCMMGSTRAIMVRLESVHLNGHPLASQLMIWP